MFVLFFFLFFFTNANANLVKMPRQLKKNPVNTIKKNVKKMARKKNIRNMET